MKKDKAKKGTKKKTERSDKPGGTTKDVDESKAEEAVVDEAPEIDEKDESKADGKESSAARESRERSKSFRQSSDAVSEGAKKTHEKHSARIEELEAENTQLKEDLEAQKSAAAKNDASTQEIERLRKELDAARRHQKPKSNSSDLTAQLATKTTVLESLELELSTLRHTLDTTKQSLSDAEARARAAEESSSSAETRLQELKTSLEAQPDAEKDDEKPEDPSKKIALLTSDLHSAQSAFTQSTTRIAALEARATTLQKLHSDAETQHATQTRSRIAELESARAEIATLKKRLSSTTNENARLRSSSTSSPPQADNDEDDDAVDELEDEARAKLEERVRALEAENFELRRGVWKARRTELQGELSPDHPASPGLFDDVDLNTPHPGMSRSLSSQGQGMGAAFGNFVNAFNKQIGEIAGGTPSNQQRYRAMSGGARASFDDEEFDEGAFAAASQAEDETRRAEELARIERVKEVKRGLVEWKGWRVDLVDLRGGPMAGVFDV